MASSSSNELDGFFDDLVRCETRIYNAIGETLRAEHGIVASQFEFLRYVRDHPGCRVADVATNFAAGIGATSKGCDRLVARGWIRRTPNPADGRSSLLRLTAKGERLVAEAEATFSRRLNELVTPAVAPDRLTPAREALAQLRGALERDRIGLPVG
ncbi:transcriptional regulator [Microlunatus endophyticus]|uniref:Transcriptional regulator n=1 Tax=Microlunatus endophyticus TaxID=1716077 RepID=A0A917RZS9_9ACTN|nr:MarR family transcriptional regulator [Microlunatus endophyticus]GGL47026.1 transcriptional regulator [Microlunatus endophyticus]